MQSGPVLAAALLFFVSACAQIPDSYGAPSQGLQEVLPDGGPPVVNGLHDLWDPACFKDCPDGLALRPVELRARPHPDAPVVAATDAYEWLSLVGALKRMRPVRGVVTQPITLGLEQGQSIELKTGDVVYIVDDRIDDYWFTGGFWSGGRMFERTYPVFPEEGDLAYVTDWQSPSDEQRKADAAAGAGWWALVERDNGQRGYVLQSALDCWWPEHDPPSYCQDGRRGPRPSSPQN